MYASQKVQIFSSLCQPETHFRHAQDLQWASAILGSIKIIQNTIITVYEVESQKTVNTKSCKRKNWILGVIKKINHHIFFGQLDQKTKKRIKLMLQSNAKVHQSLLQIPTAKKYKYLWTIDLKVPQTSYRKDLMLSKRKQFWVMPADFSPYRTEFNEKSHNSTKKIQKSVPLWPSQLWNPIGNVSAKVQ